MIVREQLMLIYNMPVLSYLIVQKLYIFVFKHFKSEVNNGV